MYVTYIFLYTLALRNKRVLAHQYLPNGTCLLYQYLSLLHIYILVYEILYYLYYFIISSILLFDYLYIYYLPIGIIFNALY